MAPECPGPRRLTSTAIPLQGGVSYTHTHTQTHTHTTYEALYQCPAKPDVTCYNGNAKRLDGDGYGNVSSPVEEIETQEV